MDFHNIFLQVRDVLIKREMYIRTHLKIDGFSSLNPDKSDSNPSTNKSISESCPRLEHPKVDPVVCDEDR